MANLLDMTDRTSADKQKALDSALAQIERQFGKGSIMKLGGDNAMRISRRPRRVRSASTSRWGSAGCPRAGSSRSTGRKARARRR
jgi:hypothetical protein